MFSRVNNLRTMRLRFSLQVCAPVQPTVCDFDRTAAGMESGRQHSLQAQGGVLGPSNCEESDEPTSRGGRPGRSILSHVATEQRRRDKINEG